MLLLLLVLLLSDEEFAAFEPLLIMDVLDEKGFHVLFSLLRSLVILLLLLFNICCFNWRRCSLERLEDEDEVDEGDEVEELLLVLLLLILLESPFEFKWAHLVLLLF